MTNRKGPTGQEKRTLEMCDGLNRFLGSHKRTGWVRNLYIIEIKTHGDHTTSLTHWRKRGWDKEVCGGVGTFTIPRSKTSYLGEPFHKAWEGLSEGDRSNLTDLSSRALSVAQAVQNDEIRFRIGDSCMLHGKPFVRFDITKGPKFEDLLLYLPTWGYVAPALYGEDRIRDLGIEKGLIITNWERGYSQTHGTAFGGDPWTEDVPTNWNAFEPNVIATGKEYFLMNAKSAKVVENGVAQFKRSLKEIFVPEGRPFKDEIRYLLAKGYEITGKRSEAARARREDVKNARDLKGLEGKTI